MSYVIQFDWRKIIRIVSLSALVVAFSIRISHSAGPQDDCYVVSVCMEPNEKLCLFAVTQALSPIIKAGPGQVGFRSEGDACGVKIIVVIPWPCGTAIPEEACI